MIPRTFEYSNVYIVARNEEKDHVTLRSLVYTFFRVGAILLNVTLGENKLMITTVSSDMFFRQYTVAEEFLNE